MSMHLARYGCEDMNPVTVSANNKKGVGPALLQQVFPLLISRVCGTTKRGDGTASDNFFSFGSCNYQIKKSKEYASARA